MDAAADELVLDGTAAVLATVVVVAVVELLPPLRLVAEGAGLNDEEAELTGDGSMEEAESMQRAESRELMDPSRLLVVPLVLCAFIHGCCRHTCAVSRLLREGGREGEREGGRAGGREGGRGKEY